MTWASSSCKRQSFAEISAGEPEKVIATPFGFIAFSNCTLYERAKPLFVDIEPNTANIDPNLIEDAIISRYVIRVGVDEPAPERQPPEQRSRERQLFECWSAVGGRVRQRGLLEPRGGGDPAFSQRRDAMRRGERR